MGKTKKILYSYQYLPIIMQNIFVTTLLLTVVLLSCKGEGPGERQDNRFKQDTLKKADSLTRS